jgi:hypothetical protein
MADPKIIIPEMAAAYQTSTEIAALEIAALESAVIYKIRAE